MGDKGLRFPFPLDEETVSSFKEPVGVVYSEELGRVVKESIGSESQGAGNFLFVSLHLVFVSSWNRMCLSWSYLKIVFRDRCT